MEVQPVPLNQDLTISGDFRQCLPVVPKASRAQIVAATISNAVFWKDVVKLKLHINMRLLAQAGQMDLDRLQYAQDFANWLLEIGDGKANSTPSHEISLPECETSKTLSFSLKANMACNRYLSSLFIGTDTTADCQNLS